MKYLIKGAFYLIIISVLLTLYNPFSISIAVVFSISMMYELIFNKLKFKTKPWIILFLAYFLISKLNLNSIDIDISQIRLNSGLIAILSIIVLFIILLMPIFQIHVIVLKYIKKDVRLVKNVFTGRKYYQINIDGWDEAPYYK
jgi:hypothetical protein